MEAFSEANIEAVIAACGANAGALAESLSQCFHRPFRIEVGESGLWSPETLPSEFHGPGVMALIHVGAQGLAVLVPASLPLPDWYVQPNDSERSRLETLSMEWSLNLLPPETVSDGFRTLVVENLARTVAQMAPTDWAATLELSVHSDGAGPAKLLVVWPLEQPHVEVAEMKQTASSPGAVEAATADTGREIRSAAPDPLARLRHLPVQISVRLAEKKIPLSSLLSITPGMLITFNKSCEDLLDLYVSNSRYCRGEAVKIGENFGLKINQIGVSEEAPRKVINA